MRASSGLRAGKQAEGTPSETDIPAHVRAYADMCCGHSMIAACNISGASKHQHHHLSSPRLPLTQVQLPGLWADVIIVVFHAENRSLGQNGLSLQ